LSAVLVDAEHLAELVARRVVELLVERGQAPAVGLVDAAELARLLGISRSTVYDNATKLGAIETGNGSARPRLRFDVERARAAWAACSSVDARAPESPAHVPVRRRPKRGRATSGVKLLPVKGPAAA
jgi:hypothetical protein